ncbi:MAG: hypothetical protein ACE5HN_06340 [Nitrospiria bacterium]
MRTLSAFLFLTLLFESAHAVESIRFYDWQADVPSKGEGAPICSIQFTGISQKRVILSMILSMVDDPRKMTLLKVTAGHINKVDLSDVTPIRIQNAWVNTSSGTSKEKIIKIDVGSDPYFLGGTDGFQLFRSLLQGIQKDGVTVVYLAGSDLETVLSIPKPPTEMIDELRPCLTTLIRG